MATMQEIADAAGVSVSTVSKALRDANDIGTDTRQRIKAIAADLGYTYRASPKPLRYSRGPNIGIVCPEVVSNYFSQMLTSMERTLTERGYSTLITLSNFGPEVEKRLLRLYTELRLDGIIFITGGHTIQPRLKDTFSDRQLPFVLVASHAAVDELDYIDMDDEHAVRVAIDHLASIGHKTIGYIGDRLTRDRRDAYLHELREASLGVVDDFVVELDERFERCGYRGMQLILALEDWPTGILCAYDAIAIGALRAAYEHGVTIPDELSIVSIDDVSEAGFLYRGLTTVSGPSVRVGKLAAEILTDQIEAAEDHVVQHISLKPHLIVRETTGPPRGLSPTDFTE